MASFTNTINCANSFSKPLFPFSPTTPFTTKSRIRTTATIPSTQQLPSSLSSSSFLSPVRKKKRGSEVVTRAGPSSTSLIFAFVMPLTLILATVFTSIKIADKLDEEFLEEIAINRAIMEEEEDDEDEDISKPVEEKPAVPKWAQEKAPAPRIRNRPKREAEV